MIRSLLAGAAALLLAACGQSAPVDLTAHFARTGGTPFAVEAAANGDARVVAGDTVFLRSGGVDYVVMQDARGSFVARQDELLALLTAAVGPPRVQPEYATAKGGTETVAGQSGSVWRVHPREMPSITSVDAVVSSDPALATMGKGLAAYTRALIVRNSRAMGAPGNLENAMIALADKGPVLRFGTVLRLERIDKAPIAPGIFRLPSAPLGKAALKARLETPDPASGAALL